MKFEINKNRLAEVININLAYGGHQGIDQGMCVMEAVSYVAGEPWSDTPACACPVITSFLRSWNDALPDDKRSELLHPLIARLVGTKSTSAAEARRATMACDWLVRMYTPAWLRLAGLTVQADALASLPEITDFANTPSIEPAIKAARRDASASRDAAGDAAGDAAWDAAWDAAGAAAGAAARDAAGAAARDAAGAAAGAAARDAAGAAARDAAGAAAWDAAGDAAGAAAGAAARAAAWDAAGAAAWDAAGAAAGDAAWDAAGAAARDAAWDAAGAAARDAAGAKLAPTVSELQTSALALVERMIEVRDSEQEVTA